MAKLPRYCYVVAPGSCEVRKITRGERGYRPWATLISPAAAERDVKRMNTNIGVTPIEAECMMAGSMFGWDCPGADPRTYAS